MTTKTAATASAKTAYAGLTTADTNAADKRLTAAARKTVMEQIAKSFLKHGLVVYAPIKGKSSTAFDVYAGAGAKDKVVAKISATMLERLIDRPAGLLIAVERDGRRLIVHRNHPLYGFNPTTVNHGLPRGMKLRDLKPGAALSVRFSDSEDCHAILIERDDVNAKKAGGREYSATALVWSDSLNEWQRISITFHQIVALRVHADSVAAALGL